MITTILFDLDGTLLPMDQEHFTRAYFKRLVRKMIPYGYDAKNLEKGIWMGIAAMVKNNGTCTNEEAFWNCFQSILGDRVISDQSIFEEFYRSEFNEVQKDCGFNAEAKRIVDSLKCNGYRVVLATNPIFPSIATEARIGWAGLNPEDFELFTTYENSHYCKPNPAYYREILQKLGVKAEECLMIGNDVTEDMVATMIGMQVYLLTDCMIHQENQDISQYPHGSFNELCEFIESLNR